MQCCLCHRELPKEAFPLKYGHVRYKSCRECHALGHSCLRPEPKPKRPKLTEEEKKARRKAYQLEYQRKYRAANREKVREYSRESIARARAGEPKRKSGPKEESKFVKQDFSLKRPSTFPLGKKKPAHAERMCKQCANYPCCAGIENLETDFAREGCHAYHKRDEVS